jgi:Spy/CpxP family protein refolding chaperone
MRLRSTLLLLAALAAGLAITISRFAAETPSESQAAHFAAHDGEMAWR